MSLHEPLGHGAGIRTAVDDIHQRVVAAPVLAAGHARPGVVG